MFTAVDLVRVENDVTVTTKKLAVQALVKLGHLEVLNPPDLHRKKKNAMNKEEAVLASLRIITRKENREKSLEWVAV